MSVDMREPSKEVFTDNLVVETLPHFKYECGHCGQMTDNILCILEERRYISSKPSYPSSLQKWLLCDECASKVREILNKE